MTINYKQRFERCRIMIVGERDFANIINTYLIKAGFRDINVVDNLTDSADIIVDLTVNGQSLSYMGKMPIVYPFDFINGGATIVLLPGNNTEAPVDGNMRLMAAKYISGYCAFWNISDCDWLLEVLPNIERSEKSVAAQETAARLCAGVVANIALDLDVKSFPQFYLTPNKP